MSRSLSAAAAVPAPRRSPDWQRGQAPVLRPSWQAQPCPAWCGGGHQETDYYADRAHFASVPEVIDLTLYDNGDDRGSAPGRLDLALWQHYREAEATVDLTVPACEGEDKRHVTRETDLMLTVDEARALRDGLTALLALVDGAAGGAR